MNTALSPTLPSFHRRVQANRETDSLRPVTIVALGDSVTAGIGLDDQFFVEEVYHAQLQILLEERYPCCYFTVINAGVNGQCADGGMPRLQSDAIRHHPDLILIGFGLNDAVGHGMDGLDKFADILKSMIVRIRQETESDIILLTPNFMLRQDNERVPDKWRFITGQLMQVQNDEVLAAYAESIRNVGLTHHVPVADIYAAWEALEAQGRNTTDMLVNGLNHPDEAGHRLAAEVIAEVIWQNEDR